MTLFVVILVMTLALTIDAIKTTDKNLSPFGKYYKKSSSLSETRKNPPITVGSECQSLKLRHEIDYALKKYPAVEESLKNSYIECNMAYVDDIGLERTCPIELKRATQVYIKGEECAVAKPEYQCATFTECRRPRMRCSGSRSKGCVRAGYRYFRVWVYCKSCGFKLVKLRLAQCCSCREIEQN